MTWLWVGPSACRPTILNLIHICLRKAAIHGNAFLMDRSVDSMCFGRDGGLPLARPDSTMRLIVGVHDDLILALCDGHRGIDLARRGPRRLASWLFRCFMHTAVVALSG